MQKQVRIAGKLDGHRGSSTRAEIAGILMALNAGIAAHIATDSQSAMTTFLILKRCAQQRACRNDDQVFYDEWPLGNHWMLINDGDLWEQVWQNLTARKDCTTKITKVKGHATKDHVESGLATAKDKWGNDLADLVADEGVKNHGHHTLELGRLYAK